MWKPTAKDEKLAAVLLKVIRRHWKASPPEPESMTTLADAIHRIWVSGGNSDFKNKLLRSSELRKANNDQEVIDYPVPLSYLTNKLLTMDKEDFRIPYIASQLKMYAHCCLISLREKVLLTDAGLEAMVPNQWNCTDRYARYSDVGISMGETELFDKNSIVAILTHPPAPFYVYRLRTPTKKVFYIGKGVKRRVLSHEREIYKDYFRTHTNWKKLNKIAQIIQSGKELKYEIESWHLDESQAYLREEELILLAERDNPWLLTNSNGSRGKGKPNRQLRDLRQARGLYI